MGNCKSARLITVASFDAASNMAIDEAILEAHLAGLVPPTLRIYKFDPPAISLGYAQKLDEKTLANIASQSISIVRRPTGGRAVLHQGDLTYSFVASSLRANQSQDLDRQSVWLSETVLGAYQQICQALIFACAQLGIDLEMGARKSIAQSEIDCFQATTVADLHFQGRKLVGSAQVRRKGAILQHGSIILNQPQDLMHSLLGQIDVENSEQPFSHHANLFEILGGNIPIEEIQDALVSGFEKAFSMKFVPASLNDEEHHLCENLRHNYVLAEPPAMQRSGTGQG